MENLKLLQILLNEDNPITFHALARAIESDISSVQKSVNQFRDSGCIFNVHPQRGIQLEKTGLGVWQDYLEYFLDGMGIGGAGVSGAGVSPAIKSKNKSKNKNNRIIKVYSQTSSTQDIARQIVETSHAKAQAALAIADWQTAGRGRMGRKWIAPKDSAAVFSRVFLPGQGAIENISIDKITFAVSVAAARALDGFLKTGDSANWSCHLDWPNDLMVNGKKIGGILVEHFTSSQGLPAAIIGIGINTSLAPEQLPNDRNLRQRVTSLAMNGANIDRLAVIAQINKQLDAALLKSDITDLLDEWRQRCTMMRKFVTLRSGGRQVSGEVVDLDPYAGLVMRSGSGELLHLPAQTTTKVV